MAHNLFPLYSYRQGGRHFSGGAGPGFESAVGILRGVDGRHHLHRQVGCQRCQRRLHPLRWHRHRNCESLCTDTKFSPWAPKFKNELQCSKYLEQGEYLLPTEPRTGMRHNNFTVKQQCTLLNTHKISLNSGKGWGAAASRCTVITKETGCNNRLTNYYCNNWVTNFTVVIGCSPLLQVGGIGVGGPN